MGWAAPSLVLLASVRAGRGTTDDTKSPIWFVSWQHTGHIKALCPIAFELQARGWSVRIAAHEEMESKVPQGLQFERLGQLPWTWDEELSFRRLLWDPSPPKPGDKEFHKAGESDRYFTGSQQSLAEGLNQSLEALPVDQRPGLLVVDVSSVGAMDVAVAFHIPFAVVSPWPVGPTLHSVGDESAAAHSWLPSELFAFPQSSDQRGFGDRLRRATMSFVVPWLAESAGFHQPRRDLRALLGLPSGTGGGAGGRQPVQLLEPPRDSAGRHPLMLILSHWGLDRPRPLPPHVRLVGPVDDYDAIAKGRTAKLPSKVQQWLSQPGTRIVYVSFGTNVQPRPWILRALLGGMMLVQQEEKEHPGGDVVRFLWDVAKSDVAEQAQLEDPDGVGVPKPSNVLFAERVDQLGVLASGNVSAFVSHCGLNSVHEAMHFGVPVVGMPFLGDQLISSYLLPEVGAGVRLSVPRLVPEAFADAVRDVAMNDSFREGAAHVGRLGRLAGGARASADALEEVAQFGNAHFQTIGNLDAAVGRLWDVRIVFALLPLVLLAGIVILCLLWRPGGEAADWKARADEARAARDNALSKAKSKARKGGASKSD